MGIRFFCPNGHRLNVKSFLAGKRGVCPDCGIGVDIPMQSDEQAASKKKKRSVKAAELANGNGHATTAVLDHQEPDRAVPAPHDFALPASLGAPSSAATAPVIATPNYALETALETVHPAPATVTTTPAPLKSKSVVKQDVAAAMAPVAPQPSLPTPAPPVEPAASDPISEAPLAVWYVRPPAGGQYGPARGDVMRKWLGEGRVTADSLVWREGWSDWRQASKVFPSLGPSKSPGMSGRLPVIPETSRRVRTQRKPSTASGIGIVIGLGVVCVFLFMALLYVLMNSGSTPTP